MDVLGMAFSRACDFGRPHRKRCAGGVQSVSSAPDTAVSAFEGYRSHNQISKLRLSGLERCIAYNKSFLFECMRIAMQEATASVTWHSRRSVPSHSWKEKKRFPVPSSRLRQFGLITTLVPLWFLTVPSTETMAQMKNQKLQVCQAGFEEYFRLRSISCTRSPPLPSQSKMGRSSNCLTKNFLRPLPCPGARCGTESFSLP